MGHCLAESQSLTQSLCKLNCQKRPISPKHPINHQGNYQKFETYQKSQNHNANPRFLANMSLHVPFSHMKILRNSHGSSPDELPLLPPWPPRKRKRLRPPRRGRRRTSWSRWEPMGSHGKPRVKHGALRDVAAKMLGFLDGPMVF